MLTSTLKTGRLPVSCACRRPPAAVTPRNPRRVMFMMISPLLQRSLLFRHRRAAAGANLVASAVQGLQNGRPLFQMRGENLLPELAGPLRDAQVELGRRDADLVGERRP